MPLETTRWSARDHLDTLAEQAAYLDAALDDGDPTLIAAVLGDIARARGLAEFAHESGIAPDTIAKTFTPGGNPSLESITKAMKALGLKLKSVAA